MKRRERVVAHDGLRIGMMRRAGGGQLAQRKPSELVVLRPVRPARTA